MNRFAALVAAIVIVGVPAGDAAATTVTYTPGRVIDRYSSSPPTLVVEAGSAEANAITLEHDSGGTTIRVADAAGIDDPVSRYCGRTDAYTVACLWPAETTVRAGDLDDAVSTPVGCPHCVVYGGDGDDQLQGMRLHGGNGDDALDSKSPPGLYAELSGGEGADVLTGADGHDHMFGGGGTDRLTGGGGSDNLNDGDTSANADADVLAGGDGDDDIDQLYYDNRTSGVEVDLTAQPGLAGQPGEHDEISGFERVHGGSGADRLSVGEFHWAFGGEGDDTLLGDDTEQYLYPGAGRDTVRAGGGHDTAGAIGPEPDYIDLGDGNDLLELGPPARIDLGNPAWEHATAYVVNVERLHGSQAADVLIGDDAQNFIDGDAGNDVIDARGGEDFVDGDYGNDRIAGGLGDDDIRGGIDDDLLHGGDGNDLIEGGVNDVDLFDAGYADSDKLFGGRGDDQLRGYWHDDVLRGGVGADLLYGGFGADVVSGGPDSDLVDGEGDDDRVLGGPGADRLFGRTGADNVIGGFDVDVFDAGSGPDRVDARDGLEEQVACGAGRDGGRADRRDLMSRCERVRTGRPTPSR